MKEKLTVEKLKEMKPHTIFATGQILGNQRIAIRGDFYDWAIYRGNYEESPDFIAKFGNKIFDKELIEFLVPADKEALLLYRN
jgi:hypothetical protein